MTKLHDRLLKIHRIHHSLSISHKSTHFTNEMLRKLTDTVSQKMAENGDVGVREPSTFPLNYGDGSQDLETIIVLFDEKIECPMTPTIEYQKLKGIKINHLETPTKPKSFELKLDSVSYNFTAQTKDQRNDILLEILKRCPSNDVSEGMWITILLAEDDRNEEAVLYFQHDVVQQTEEIPSFPEELAVEKGLKDEEDAMTDIVVNLEIEERATMVFIEPEKTSITSHVTTVDSHDTSDDWMCQQITDLQRERCQLQQEKHDFVAYKANFQHMMEIMLAKREQLEEAHQERAEALCEEVTKMERERFKVRMDASKLQCMLLELRSEKAKLQNISEKMNRPFACAEATTSDPRRRQIMSAISTLESGRFEFDCDLSEGNEVTATGMSMTKMGLVSEVKKNVMEIQGNVFTFQAKNRKQRNAILMEILSRFSTWTMRPFEGVTRKQIESNLEVVREANTILEEQNKRLFCRKK